MNAHVYSLHVPAGHTGVVEVEHTEEEKKRLKVIIKKKTKGHGKCQRSKIKFVQVVLHNTWYIRVKYVPT